MRRVWPPLAFAAVLAVPALLLVGCDDAEKCASCDLAKGSPGCCKLPAQ